MALFLPFFFRDHTNPPELAAVERFFSRDVPVETLRGWYLAAVAALEAGLADALDFAEGRMLDHDSAEHFIADWLGPYFEKAEPMRDGFVGALRAAYDAGLPLSLVYVPDCGLGPVSHVVGVNAVTVLIARPDMPALLGRAAVEEAAVAAGG